MTVRYVSLALAALALGSCRGGDSDKPPVHLIRNMFTQERAKAYTRDTSGLFADGRAMRAPVEGTVSTAEVVGDDLFEEGLDQKGEPSKNFPDLVKVDGKIPDSLADRGHSRYVIYCSPCHGIEGDGKGTVAQAALDGGPRLEIPPPAMTSDRVRTLVAGKIYAAIKNGVNNGNMFPYAAQVPTADRWAIIAYIRRDLQKQPYESGENVTVGPIATASAEAGAALFKAKACVGCHSLDGSRLVGPTFKGLYMSKQPIAGGTEVVADDAYLKESMLNPAAKIVDGYPPAMPPQQLNDIELKSLILYIASVK